MSRHHIMPPVVYTPPAPKKIETRKRRIQVGSFDDMDELGETHEATGFGPSTPANIKLPLQNFTPVEGAEQKPQHPRGRLSESTLKVMLAAQELE
ncbi:hypothetical protein [Bradyrhizobium sp.]|jgi:hypothetical protein|uniref:hypothetical protein n=1 Tax=Bradyrhizobium sp. TaxID=376 RepID=UPI003D0A33BA